MVMSLFLPAVENTFIRLVLCA